MNPPPPSTLITNIKTESGKDSTCAWKTVSGALSLHPHLAEVEKAGTPDSSLSWILKQFLEIARWLFLFLSCFKSISEYSRMSLYYQTNCSDAECVCLQYSFPELLLVPGGWPNDLCDLWCHAYSKLVCAGRHILGSCLVHVWMLAWSLGSVLFGILGEKPSISNALCFAQKKKI